MATLRVPTRKPSRPLPEATHPKRILIVDDEKSAASRVEAALADSEYDVRVAYDGSDALRLVETWQPDLALLDLEMAPIDGFTLARSLQSLFPDLIVVFVTSHTRVEDEVAGLVLGDEYITKPFKATSLAMRINARFKQQKRDRKHALAGTQPTMIAGTNMTPQGRPVQLTLTEAQLFNALLAGAGKTVSRDDLLDSVWKDKHNISPTTLDTNISRLRGKIEPDPKHPRYIITALRHGYRLDINEWFGN